MRKTSRRSIIPGGQDLSFSRDNGTTHVRPSTGRQRSHLRRHVHPYQILEQLTLTLLTSRRMAVDDQNSTVCVLASTGHASWVHYLHRLPRPVEAYRRMSGHLG